MAPEHRSQENGKGLVPLKVYGSINLEVLIMVNFFGLNKQCFIEDMECLGPI